MADHRDLLSPGLPGPGRSLVLLGATTSEPESAAGEVALRDLLVEAARDGLADAARAIDATGLAAALATAAVEGGCGCAIGLPGDAPPHVVLFGPHGARALVSCRAERTTTLISLAERFGVACARLGETGGSRVVVEGEVDVALAQLERTMGDATA